MSVPYLGGKFLTAWKGALGENIDMSELMLRMSIAGAERGITNINSASGKDPRHAMAWRLKAEDDVASSEHIRPVADSGDLADELASAIITESFFDPMEFIDYTNETAIDWKTGISLIDDIANSVESHFNILASMKWSRGNSRAAIETTKFKDLHEHAYDLGEDITVGTRDYIYNEVHHSESFFREKIDIVLGDINTWPVESPTNTSVTSSYSALGVTIFFQLANSEVSDEAQLNFPSITSTFINSGTKIATAPEIRSFYPPQDFTAAVNAKSFRRSNDSDRTFDALYSALPDDADSTLAQSQAGGITYVVTGNLDSPVDGFSNGDTTPTAAVIKHDFTLDATPVYVYTGGLT